VLLNNNGSDQMETENNTEYYPVSLRTTACVNLHGECVSTSLHDEIYEVRSEICLQLYFVLIMTRELEEQ
jgi:hypothetical protein